MADVITVTIPDLPAIADPAGDALIAVWQGNRLGKIRQGSLRGTRTHSGAGDPPSDPPEIAPLGPILGDRWRNTVTGTEWKVTSLMPFVWTPDGSVKGDPGASNLPGPPGPAGPPGPPASAEQLGTALADKAARARRPVPDAGYTAVATDVYIGITTLTAARTITLPAALAFPAGQPLYVADESGNCSSTLLITIAAAGSDKIGADTSVTMGLPFQKLTFHSNGSNLWTVA